MMESLKRWWRGSNKKPNVTEKEILRLLASCGGSTYTVAELAGTSPLLDKNALPAQLRRLERRGWVSSEPYVHTPMRRLYSYSITDLGWDIYWDRKAPVL